MNDGSHGTGTVAAADRLALRPLAAADAERLLTWRNDPFIVARSLSRREVQPDEHRRWFTALLQRHDVLAWVVEVAGRPIGHARAEPQAQDWLLTIYLAQDATGHGWGVRAIELACQACAQSRPWSAVIAEVVPGNRAALSAFLRAGFQRCPDQDRPDALILTWRRVAGEEARTVAHYEALMSAHGDSFRALDWGSAAGQRLRFEVLAGVGDLANASVLDVGCGLAHFADWLDERGMAAGYTGLDLVPALLEGAARRRPDLRLVAGSILDPAVLAGEQFDYVFASGVFYTYSDGADDVLRQSVCRMWELARRGVAFNALSTHAPDREPGEYYADPETVLDFCRGLTPRAELVTGYHPRDFTVYLRREG
ncbi:bifunctional GNAT family N-acetyltransferase/class I SAM-dependent methyltransferase [Caenimonas sedimenti]|uniref:bifunctional GNAT family N-acetyltransferase/class I SAM-dependent methyltransferase n=1 Tax=Caenimonas sedimenti TaxID=2596921 RepID=UPI00164692F3|nr:bifunctional GNAT family N-acetyltransferase/class I SAM-dependent methyltransferase [Caenimonas sedimenti]